MPVTTNLDRALDSEGVEAIVARAMKKNSAIENNRKTAFGRSGGIMKGLLDKRQAADRDMKRTIEWIMAATEKDVAYLKKAQQQYSKDVIEAYNSDELSDIEFKVLSPANEGTNSAGGYNVPLPFAAELSRNLGTYGYARKYFRKISMERNKIGIAGLLTKPSVSIIGENSAIPASKPVLDQLVLTTAKIAAIYPATNEYLADANIDVLAAMIEIFGEQFGIKEDTNALQNDNTTWNGLLWYGAGTITGNVAANGALAVSRLNNSAGGKTGFPQIGDAPAAADFWTDLLVMMGQQPSALYQAGQYWFPQEVMTAMLSMRDSQFRFIANTEMGLDIGTGQDGQPMLQYRGYECVVVPAGVMITYDASAHVSTPFLAFLNPQRSWCCMGLRGGFEVDMSISATADTVNAFTNDLKLFRLKERVAFGVGRPNTIVVLRTDAS